MQLEEMEKDYLKLFLEIVDKNGLYSLVDACQNKEFAMYPFIRIISKLIKD